jgi:hypothetical protein
MILVVVQLGALTGVVVGFAIARVFGGGQVPWLPFPAIANTTQPTVTELDTTEI